MQCSAGKLLVLAHHLTCANHLTAGAKNPPDPNLILHERAGTSGIHGGPTPQPTGPEKSTANILIPDTTRQPQRSCVCWGACTIPSRWFYCCGWSLFVHMSYYLMSCCLIENIVAINSPRSTSSQRYRHKQHTQHTQKTKHESHEKFTCLTMLLF